MSVIFDSLDQWSPHLPQTATTVKPPAMPGRLRQATASAAEQRSDVPYIPGLQFNESLTWRAGKAIPVADLLARLLNLSEELKSLEQDQVDRTSFTRVAQDLASANLIGHKDKGIRAYTACCVVDILRLCAPDAPFKNAQLKVCKKINLAKLMINQE